MFNYYTSTQPCADVTTVIITMNAGIAPQNWYSSQHAIHSKYMSCQHH